MGMNNIKVFFAVYFIDKMTLWLGYDLLFPDRPRQAFKVYFQGQELWHGEKSKSEQLKEWLDWKFIGYG